MALSSVKVIKVTTALASPLAAKADKSDFDALVLVVGGKVDESDLAAVATSGEYNDLAGKPTLGSAAGQNSTAFATAAQGGKADTALQPNAPISNLSETPTAKIMTDAERLKLAALPAEAQANDVAATIARQGRPGDALGLFTSTINGAGAAGSVPPGTTAVNDRGAVQRVTGSGVVALRERVALLPGRKLQLRFAVTRSTDPTDPAGDTVRLAAQGLTANKALVGDPRVVADITLHVADGRQERTAIIAFAAADDVDLIWPPTARYMTLYVQTYGSDGVTDIELIDWSDVTDELSGGADVSALTGRVDAIEDTLPTKADVSALNAEIAAREGTDEKVADVDDRAPIDAIYDESGRTRLGTVDLITGRFAPSLREDGETLAYSANDDSIIAPFADLFTSIYPEVGPVGGATVDPVTGYYQTSSAISATPETEFLSLYDESGQFSAADIDMSTGYYAPQLQANGEPVFLSEGGIVKGLDYFLSIYPESGEAIVATVDITTGYFRVLTDQEQSSEPGFVQETTYTAEAWVSGDQTILHYPNDIDTTLFLFIVLGQSNAQGQNADTADALVAGTAVYPSNALMFADGPRRQSYSSNPAVTPLIEKVSGSGQRETLLSSAVNHFIRDMNAAFSKMPKCLGMVTALGSQRYMQLKRGTVTYEATLSVLDDAVSYAAANGFTRIQTILIQNGQESDQGIAGMSRARYRRQIEQWHRQLSADVMARTGEIEPPTWLFNQIGTDPSPNTITQAWVHPTRYAALELDDVPNMRCYGPTYQYPMSDVIHKSCLGQNRTGQDVAKAAMAELFGTGMRATRSRSTTRLSATQFRILYDSMSTALTLDTSGDIVSPTDLAASGYWFEDGSGSPPTITAVTVSNLNVTITLSAAPTGPYPRWGYGIFGTDPAATTTDGQDGPILGARGLLRGTDGHVSIYDSATIYDWALAEVQPLPVY